MNSMGDQVIIRHVETKTIKLEDTYTQIFTIKSGFKTAIAFLCFTSIMYMIDVVVRICIGVAEKPLPIIIFIILGLGAALVIALLGAFDETIPAYEVILEGQYYSRRVIPKTTPGNDQVAICRAAKVLEAKARTILKKEHDLEQIAQNCNNEV